MSKQDPKLDNFGQLECEGPEERIVIRICGVRLGVANGWSWWGGHTIMFNEVVMDKHPLLAKLVGEVEHILVDYYIGEVVFINDKQIIHQSPVKDIVK